MFYLFLQRKGTSMVKNLFVKGPRGIGKSTLISSVIKNNRLPVSGFKTTKTVVDEGLTRFSMIDVALGESSIIAEKRPGGITVCGGVFDHFGVKILNNSMKSKSLILMDELGFMELKSPIFRRQVHRVLDGENPVLGVIRDHDNEFLESVARRGDVLTVSYHRCDQFAYLFKFINEWIKTCALRGQPEEKKEDKKCTGMF